MRGYRHLNLDFVYVAHRVEDVKGALAGMRALENFRGLSVTIPHKIEVMRYMDEIDPVDRAIGSINTVVHEKDRLIGLGTDGPGAFEGVCRCRCSGGGKSILMIGSGGAARAIAFTMAMKTKLAELLILDIDDEMRKGLTADLQAGTDARIRSDNLNDDSLPAAMSTADVIIHCTPVGMHPNVDASLVPAELFRSGQVVFDAVYTPLKTRLLKDAADRGLTVISGVEMFVNQAVLQFEQFTGQDAPVAVMRKVVMEHLQS